MLMPIFWAVRWIIWELSGIRAIWEKIRPPEKVGRRPATIGLWCTGLYIVFFSLVSNRYENKVIIINTRATALFSQINSVASPNTRRELAFNQIPLVQRMNCPVEPSFWNPARTVYSLVGSPTFHWPSAEMLRMPLADVMEAESDSLQGITLIQGYVPNINLYSAGLSGADLSGATLTGSNLIEADLTKTRLSFIRLDRASLIEADFTGATLQYSDLSFADAADINLSSAILHQANLTEANLTDATLIGAELNGSDLSRADLTGAVLIGADLSEAILVDANLSGTFFSGANLAGADLTGANLSESDLNWASNLTVKQLSKAATLYGAQMDDFLRSQLEKDFPDLFISEPDSL